MATSTVALKSKVFVFVAAACLEGNDNVLGLITFKLGLISAFGTNIKIHISSRREKVTFYLCKEVAAVGVEDTDGAAVIDDEYCKGDVGSVGDIYDLERDLKI
ncbi:hypothetical protein Glove_33g293 [Diversispora epigaea]|uniref:Uncharacterized protein n=1 Tax=Diversispora epigaea TaxID=1348612 RepID=A0A397JHZ8_9GLOM|nr:hypothetical protein Glove_33g293 [Diversispora epigaea]